MATTTTNWCVPQTVGAAGACACRAGAKAARYAKAKADGFFIAEIAAVHNGTVLVSEDEHPRPQTDMDALTKLRALFDGGVTALAPSAVTLNATLRTSGDAVSLGDAGTPEGTYVGMVRHNVNTIVDALGSAIAAARSRAAWPSRAKPTWRSGASSDAGPPTSTRSGRD